MKALTKLTLLLTLIVVGRYLRPAEPASASGREKNIAYIARPDTLRFATYSTAQAFPLAPVSQRTPPTKTQNDPTYPVWY